MSKDLKVKRASKGYTQEELASLVGVTKEYYNMVENNKRTPSVSTAKKISEILGIEWTSFYEKRISK